MAYTEENLTDFFSFSSYSSSSYHHVSDSNYHEVVYDKASKVIIKAIMPIIFIIGITGNVLVILMITRCRLFHTPTNIYLVSLALADLTFLLASTIRRWVIYSTSPVLVEDVGGLGDKAVYFCIIFESISNWSGAVSCAMILFIALDRYFAICHPIRFRIISTNITAIYISIAVWLIHLIPTLAYYTNQTLITYRLKWEVSTNIMAHPKTSTLCTSRYTSDNIKYLYLMDEFLAILEVPIIITLYVLAVKQLKRNSMKTLGKYQLAKRRRVINMLILTTALYIICVIPLNFNLLIYEFDINIFATSHTFHYVTALLLYINSAVNPIIYMLVRSDFRKAMKQVLFCRKTELKESLTLTTDSRTKRTRQSIEMRKLERCSSIAD
ncbi:neuromedin-U receptor 2-like [Anneissia japonica]|uniref:neuromedin-U receptor 2-like n=1 Tax=Anneissia japonica TaxID=1529436 RepID=UPI0014255BE5|nr:neuromedin-U receptor 2-like [Anneissia japonica]